MLFPFDHKITQNTCKIISIHNFTLNHFHSSHNMVWALSQQRTPHSSTISHTHSSQQRTPHSTLLIAPPTVRRAPNVDPWWVSFPFLSPDSTHGEWVSQSDPHTFDQNLTSDPHSLKPINNPTSYPPSRIRSIYIYIYICLFIYLFIYLLFLIIHFVIIDLRI